MIKIILKITLFLVFLGVIPLSCNLKCKHDSCGCSEPKPSPVYLIKSFGSKNVFIYSENNIDTSLYYSKDSIAKLVYIDEKLQTSNESENQQPGFSFVSSSFACDPVMPYSQQKISSIQIISKSTLAVNSSSSIAVGDTLNDLFEVRYRYNSSGTSIKDFVQTNSLFTPEQFLLKFKETPDAPINLVFDIKIQLTDNIVHTLTDQKLKLK